MEEYREKTSALPDTTLLFLWKREPSGHPWLRLAKLTIYIYIYIYICVCVCVCVLHPYYGALFIYKYTDQYIYIYIYVCVCVWSSTDRSVSFYQNSSVWLDIQASRSWERSPVDSNSNPRLYTSVWYIYTKLSLYIYISEKRFL